MEHSGAAMDSVSDLLVVVMGLNTALMAVMRLDVVSYHSGYDRATAIIVGKKNGENSDLALFCYPSSIHKFKD